MLLTIDIGTSGLKSALWDYEGKRLSFAAHPLTIISENDKHETECSQYLISFNMCCKELAKNAGYKLSGVKAVIISGNGPSLVPVLEDSIIKNEKVSVSVQNARLWLDRRAANYQNRVTELMGGFVDACFFLPKILKIKNEEQNLYDKTKYFLGVPEFLAYSLTGEARTVFPSDGFDRWFWDDSVLKKLELDETKFPSFIRPGDSYGKIIPVIAENFGFAKDIPVITGGPDFFAAILGSGVTEPGQACDRTGSSEGINLCTQNRIDDANLMSYGHPVKPHWNLSGVLNTSGMAIEWCRDLLQIKSFDEFFSLAKQSTAGSGGVVFNPYLCGERSLERNKMEGFWRGLNLSTKRCDLANSVLEGIGFAIKDIISAMEKKGAAANQLRVTGKLASVAYLNQIKADITGLEILEPVYKETELLGLAIIGSCYMGKYSSYTEAIKEMVKIEKSYQPDAKKTGIYDEVRGYFR